MTVRIRPATEPDLPLILQLQKVDYRSDGYLDELYISEPYRCQGIGPQALVVAESLCRGHDVRALHLEVEGNRPKAKVLYHRHGFETLHRQRMTKHLV